MKTFVLNKEEREEGKEHDLKELKELTNQKPPNFLKYENEKGRVFYKAFAYCPGCLNIVQAKNVTLHEDNRSDGPFALHFLSDILQEPSVTPAKHRLKQYLKSPAERREAYEHCDYADSERKPYLPSERRKATVTKAEINVIRALHNNFFEIIELINSQLSFRINKQIAQKMLENFLRSYAFLHPDCCLRNLPGIFLYAQNTAFETNYISFKEHESLQKIMKNLSDVPGISVQNNVLIYDRTSGFTLDINFFERKITRKEKQPVAQTILAKWNGWLGRTHNRNVFVRNLSLIFPFDKNPKWNFAPVAVKEGTGKIFNYRTRIENVAHDVYLNSQIRKLLPEEVYL